MNLPKNYVYFSYIPSEPALFRRINFHVSGRHVIIVSTVLYTSKLRPIHFSDANFNQLGRAN
jgi:hypothetical protein